METLVVNLFGGPGTGKSTTAAGVFRSLKLRGINAELALEYAKDKVWEGNEATLENQLYVFGHQHRRVQRLLGKVPVVVTDSPILLSLVYYKGGNPYFMDMVRYEHHQMWTLDVMLERVKPYETAGRLQDEAGARALDVEIRGMLFHEADAVTGIRADDNASTSIAGIVIAMLKL